MTTPNHEERIAVLERVVVQLLALHFVKADGKESIMEYLREGVERSLSPVSPGASDMLDRLFSSALETSKEIERLHCR